MGVFSKMGDHNANLNFFWKNFFKLPSIILKGLYVLVNQEKFHLLSTEIKTHLIHTFIRKICFQQHSPFCFKKHESINGK